MLQRNHLDFPWCNAKNCWPSVDAHLWAHLRDIPTVIGCSTIVHKIHTVFFGSLYTLSMNYHLNPKSSILHSFWATTIHVICTMNDVCPWHCNAFGWHFTAWKSMTLFSIYIARRPDSSGVSSFSSISMTYCKQFSIVWTCAGGLSRELCSWLHGLMQTDSCLSSGFWMCFDRSFHKLYDITDLNFVDKFCLKFRFCFMIWL